MSPFFYGKNHYYLHNVLDKAMLSSCGKAEPKKAFPVLFIYWTLPIWSLQSLPVFCENNGETLQISIQPPSQVIKLEALFIVCSRHKQDFIISQAVNRDAS